MDARCTTGKARGIAAVLGVAGEATLATASRPTAVVTVRRRTPAGGRRRRGGGGWLPGANDLTRPGETVLRRILPMNARPAIGQAGTIDAIPPIAGVPRVTTIGLHEAIVTPRPCAPANFGRQRGSQRPSFSNLAGPWASPALRIRCIYTCPHTSPLISPPNLQRSSVYTPPRPPTSHSRWPAGRNRSSRPSSSILSCCSFLPLASSTEAFGAGPGRAILMPGPADSLANSLK